MKGSLLLILPKFYGYEKYIIKEFKELFDKVYYFHDNPFKFNLYYKIVNNFFKNSFIAKINKYYIKQINKLDCKIDYIVLIGCNYISIQVMKKLKEKYGKKVKIICYFWDSTNGFNGLRTISEYADKILSFDLDDCNKYRWRYRPLFYIPELVKNYSVRSIDYFFVGSFSKERVKFLNNIKKISNGNNTIYCKISINFFKFLYNKYILKNEDYKELKFKDVIFNNLTLKNIYELYGRSKIVFNYSPTNQSGYSMRTIECLACGCKLVTNNSYTLQIDVANSNIFVYKSQDEINVTKTFMNNIVETTSINFEKYSIKQWALDIIS